MQDEMRQLIELALTCGRSWQSPQTGYVQYCYHLQDERSHDTIPIYENLLFALALLRSRTADNIQEAKALIEKLLRFQSRYDSIVEGNFPLYLHDYPLCRDRYLGAQLLPIFYWMIKDFHAVLGSELMAHMEQAVKALMKQAVRTAIEKQPPYPMAMKIAASAIVFGTMYKEKTWSEWGQAVFDEMHRQSDKEKGLQWGSPVVLADLLVALQMVYSDLTQSPWSDLWSYIEQTWQRRAYCYLGIPLKVWQHEREPQCTLYDFFMGYFTGSYSYRTFVNHPIQLQAVLIHHEKKSFREMMESSICRYPVGSDRMCEVVQKVHYGYVVLAHSVPSQEKDKGLHHLVVTWGDVNNTHTLVCQGSEKSEITYQTVADGLDLVFHLLADSEDEEHAVAFYFDHHEGLDMMIGEDKANTFQLGDKILLNDETFSITMQFHLEEGEGQFFGHLMRGNRPSQTALKGEGRFRSFDWHLFLRTVRRTTACKVTVQVRFPPP